MNSKKLKQNLRKKIKQGRIFFFIAPNGDIYKSQVNKEDAYFWELVQARNIFFNKKLARQMSQATRKMYDYHANNE